MDRRAFLALAAAVAGCSAGEGTPAPTATPSPTETADGPQPTVSPTAAPTTSDDPSTTAAGTDPEGSTERIAAARRDLSAVAADLDVPAGDDRTVAARYAFDRERVADALGRARGALEDARVVGTADQRAAVSDLLLYASLLAAAADCYGGVVDAAEGYAAATGLGTDERATAIERLRTASDARETAATRLADARSLLATYVSETSSSSLPTGQFATDLEATGSVVAGLSIRVDGTLAKLRGLAAVEDGQLAFLDDEYDRALESFSTALARFRRANERYRDGAPDFAVEGPTLETQRCLVGAYVEITRQFQSATLEVQDGNTNEGFAEFRDARSRLRTVEDECL